MLPADLIALMFNQQIIRISFVETEMTVLLL